MLGVDKFIYGYIDTLVKAAHGKLKDIICIKTSCSRPRLGENIFL